jgi:hypothetical protein
MASLLTIIQDVADRIGLVRPSSVIGSSDHQVRQLLALANQEGREQARRHPSIALRRRDGGAAKAPGFRQGGWRWTRGGIGGGGALLARGIGRGGGIRCRQCNMRESRQEQPQKPKQTLGSSHAGSRAEKIGRAHV